MLGHFRLMLLSLNVFDSGRDSYNAGLVQAQGILCRLRTTSESDGFYSSFSRICACTALCSDSSRVSGTFDCSVPRATVPGVSNRCASIVQCLHAE